MSLTTKAASLVFGCALVACAHETSTTTESTTPSVASSTHAVPPRALPVADAFPEAPEASCGPFSALGALTPVPVLAGRLLVPAPSDAISSARPRNIMAADISDARETRLMVDRDDARLVVFIEETFASPTADLRATVATIEAERVDEGIVAPRTLASGLRTVIVEPTSSGGPPGGVMIANAYVVMPEGTLVTVGIYVTPDAVERTAGCHAMARSILYGITGGTTHLDTSAGERSLGEHLTITLPAGHALTHDEGPDFDVFRVQPIVPLDEPPSSLGIYLGHHPSFEPEGAESHGPLLGQDVAFYRSEAPNEVRVEALARAPSSGEAVHVFVNASSGSRADVLVGIARTLRAR